VDTLEGALKSVTVSEGAYVRLRQMILTGRIPIGAKLDEKKLSESMEVSRTPVREAIGRLEKEGLVESRPYQGSYVRRLSAKYINDLYVVREELEALATRLAAARMTTQDLERLGAILKESEIALAEANLEAYATADRRMHEFIVEQSDNVPIKDALERIGLLIALARNMVNKEPGMLETTNVQRHDLYALLVDENVEGAVRAMRDHIRSVKEALVDAMAANRE
jgi:DNA-binding GntR family transcriptional regulator